MKEWLITITEPATALIDFLALIVVVFGTAEAFLRAAMAAFRPDDGHSRRDIWLRYARWLVAGLTFQLAADIIETAIYTSWDSVARIAAIGVIRTFLNFFLDRDLREVRARQHEG